MYKKEGQHMKQKKLIREIHKACCNHDDKKLAELRKKEFRKILKRRAEGKPFGIKWTLINL